MVPFDVDFPTINTLDIDLTLMVQQRRMTVIQTVFIDASACDASVSLQVVGTDLTIEAQELTQGYYPLLVPSSPKFVCSSASTGPCKLIFLNVPVPASVWHSTASIGTFSGTITGPVVATAPASGAVPVLTAQAGGVNAWTDHSTTTPNPAADTVLFAASAAGARYYVRVKAPETGDLWINPKGGVAAVDGAGCFKIPAGSLYENFPGESVFEAWHYFTVATSVALFAQTQEGN